MLGRISLHPSPSADAEPDLPAWEQEPLSIERLRGEPVLPTGPNDRYTRLSRAVLFLSEANGGVSGLHFAAGLALGEDAQAPDPMASFRAGSNGLVRMTFHEGRALWRDLPALLPNPSGESQAAAVLNYAISLRQSESFDAVFQPLLIAGLASDQAKLLRWRAEQVALPEALLMEPGKALQLRQYVAMAEELFGETRQLASGMLADTLPDSASKDTRTRARELLNAGPFASTYFASAERALPDLMSLIAGDEFDKADIFWSEALRTAASTAWQQVQTGLGASPAALRAEAKYHFRFTALLNRQVPISASLVAKEA